MYKSVILKNKIILYYSFLITFFIVVYLIYFLINGQRGLLKYFYLKKQKKKYNQILADVRIENENINDKIQRLKTNSIDLDFLDEQIKKNLGFIDKNEIVIILNE